MLSDVRRHPDVPDVPRLCVTKGLSSVRARALQCWCSNVCCCCLLPLVTVGGCHLCFGGLCWEVVRLFVFVLGKEDNTNGSTLHRMIGFVQFPWPHCCPNTLWGVSVIAVKRLLVNPGIDGGKQVCLWTLKYHITQPH